MSDIDFERQLENKPVNNCLKVTLLNPITLYVFFYILSYLLMLVASSNARIFMQIINLSTGLGGLYYLTYPIIIAVMKSNQKISKACFIVNLIIWGLPLLAFGLLLGYCALGGFKF